MIPTASAAFHRLGSVDARMSRPSMTGGTEMTMSTVRITASSIQPRR
ncbi:Uncharacterised protein [Bordetella parapertussis]|nr:Uncharacterised protein [Bordetella parapertussis]SUV59117.1 Uncharacterised protein [Bordetella parapertussis]SUV79783.1 Uncharacterised protein [Bordetella parapertussis]VEF52374.1 Uncharacterised protein [Bordetella parapertussis]VTR29352.1 Uncharacterised protein [Bordetella parapertussis]